MYRLIAVILNLILSVAFGPEPTKTPQAWDAKSITWQKTDPEGPSGRCCKEEATYRAKRLPTRRLYRLDFTTFTRTVRTREWRSFKAC